MKIKAQIDRMVGENNRIKAYASVILGGEYVVRDIAVMDSKNGLFARMPYRSYKDRNGDMKYSDTVFAMNETSRNAINDAVLAAYEQRLHMEQDESPDMEESIRGDQHETTQNIRAPPCRLASDKPCRMRHKNGTACAYRTACYCIVRCCAVGADTIQHIGRRCPS